jgi:hypothetical protein
MEQIHIQTARELIGKGQLTLIYPRILQIGKARFRNQEGAIVYFEVIKHKHF